MTFGAAPHSLEECQRDRHCLRYEGRDCRYLECPRRRARYVEVDRLREAIQLNAWWALGEMVGIPVVVSPGPIHLWNHHTARHWLRVANAVQSRIAKAER